MSGTSFSKLVVLVLILLSHSDTARHAVAGPVDWMLPSKDAKVVGTPTWWKRQKKTAVFVPGEGYQVPGVDGFFDEQGRPIQVRVAKVVKQKENHGLLHDAKVIESVDEIKSQFGMGPDQQIALQSYQSGEALFKQQEYDQAATAFKAAIARGPGSRVEQDGMFYLAESYFFSDDYSKAQSHYDDLLEKYPNSPHLDTVVRRQFAIARYWEQHHEHDPHWVTTPNLLDDTRPWFDTLGNAMKTYEGIRLKDPTGPLADDAVMAAGISYFLRGRFEDADYQYKVLREEYPQSDHQFEAHILGLQCKLRMYQGPDYDGTPLEDAKKLVKQLKQQFAGKLSHEERERLTDIQAELNEKLAERDFVTAKYYDETEHYSSARFYYQKIAQQYPNSSMGIESGKRYQELAGKPEHPVSNVGWLLDMFPENAERKTIRQVPLVAPESEIGIASRPETVGSQGHGSTIQR